MDIPSESVVARSSSCRELDDSLKKLDLNSEVPQAADISSQDRKKPMPTTGGKSGCTGDAEGDSGCAGDAPGDGGRAEDAAEDSGCATSAGGNDGKNNLKVKGRKGKRIRLITNYVRVVVENQDDIYEYRVSFRPRVDNLELRKKLMDQFDDFLGTKRIFDGVSLFLQQELPKETILHGHHPKHPDNPLLGITVTLNRRGRKTKDHLVKLFNVLFRRVMISIGKFELKRSFFDPDVKFSLPFYKLQIWPGICMSTEQQEHGLMLCLDTSYRVFRTDTVYEYYCASCEAPDWRKRFKEFMVGQVVVTHYNNFTYRVDDIDWELSPATVFECDGKSMTYIEYYNSQYNIQIKDHHQPLLQSRIKIIKGHKETEEIKIICIIPELCYVVGMAYEYYNASIRKEISRYTFTSSAQRVNALNAFLKRLQEIPEAQEILNSWSVKLGAQLLELDGREISGPMLKFGEGLQLKDPGSTFHKESRESCFDAISQKKWSVICSPHDVQVVKKFIKCYEQACLRMKIPTCNSVEIVKLRGTTPLDYREALIESANPENIHFTVVVMPQIRREIYSVIKSICISERPIASQVVLSKNLNEQNIVSTVRNIALQINCKLGGSLWGLKIPLPEKIMFVGIDVYHDVKKLNVSVVALIASLNNTCTKYFSKTHYQRIHQEITDNMKPLFSEAIECYRETNGIYPDRIIVFRDGGSMSAKKLLIEHEVKPMLSAIKDFCPEMKNFVYVVVAKRVPQRIFTYDKYDRVVNPNPGIVVDHSITYPGMFDFYVVSQCKQQATVSPTHYMVIFNMGEISPDLLQKFAYSTSFMYFNWSGVIKIPAMVQYAHKLSSLVGHCLKAEPSSSLERTLYYL